jgi:hypothetical protein
VYIRILSQVLENPLDENRVLIMFGLLTSLLVLCATLVVVSYADLISSLTQKNIIFLAPGHDGYSASSMACKSIDLFLCYPAVMI